MTRRAPIAAIFTPLSIALVMTLALCASVFAQGQTRPTAPATGAQRPGSAPTPSAAVAATGAKISGQVLAADTGLPAKRVQVLAIGSAIRRPPAPAGGVEVPTAPTVAVGGRRDSLPAGMAQREAVTDDGGRFEMTALPAGRYTVSVRAEAPFLSPSAQAVQLTTGGSASVTFRLERGGAITGRVLDHDGDPLVRAQVSALQRRYIGGVWRLASNSTGSFASTDDLGQFRLFGLPPGEYYVVASFSMPRQFIDTQGSESQPKLGYAPTFYPSAPEFESALNVTVRSAQDTGGIDIPLVRARLGSVSVRATDSTGSPISGSRGYVMLRLADDMVMAAGGGYSTRRRDDGTFLVSNVLPGRYIVAASVGTGGAQSSGPAEFASTSIVVAGDDIAVDIQTNTGATLSGRVVIEGAAPAPSAAASGPTAGGGVRVSMRSVDSGSSPGMSLGNAANIGEDLTFEFTGLRGRLAPSAIGPRMAMKSAVSAGDDIMLKGLHLAGTERIEGVIITLTTDVATIDGAVTTSGGDPAEALVVVFSEDASKWEPGSPFVRTMRTRLAPLATPPGVGAPAPGAATPGAATPGPQPSSAYAGRDGGFVLTGLVPGHYYVAVLPATDDPYAASRAAEPATDRESLEKLRLTARTVNAVAGGPVSLELRLPK